jgi:hypothetical protein
MVAKARAVGKVHIANMGIITKNIVNYALTLITLIK